MIETYSHQGHHKHVSHVLLRMLHHQECREVMGNH